jgi:hypothetical protein
MVFALVLIASSAIANAQPYDPPINGIYKSTDLPGGTILKGYFSESWVTATPGHGQIGNTINAASWDGTDLGGEWRVWCPSIALPPTLISDGRDVNGDGEVTWQTYYEGGKFWFSQNGPWSTDHLVDFTGDVHSFTVTTTYQYAFGGMLIGIRSNITFVGNFDLLDPRWDDTCIVYEINNSSFFGSTDDGPKPPEFPMFLDPTGCPNMVAVTPALGGWGDVTHITIAINDCALPTKESTWGAIKTLYSE